MYAAQLQCIPKISAMCIVKGKNLKNKKPLPPKNRAYFQENGAKHYESASSPHSINTIQSKTSFDNLMVKDLNPNLLFVVISVEMPQVLHSIL